MNKNEIQVFVIGKPQENYRPIEIPFYIDKIIENNCCGTCEKCLVYKICKENIKSIGEQQ
jgi:hypothetical protein